MYMFNVTEAAEDRVVHTIICWLTDIILHFGIRSLIFVFKLYVTLIMFVINNKVCRCICH